MVAMTKYITKVKSVVGARNKNKGKENEDKADVFNIDNKILAVISDGCSNCGLPSMAASINNNVAKTIAAEPDLFDMSDKFIKELIKSEYTNAFESSGYDKDQLCATTAWVIIDTLNDRYIAWALGDTAILSFGSNMKTETFYEPVNFFKKSITCFTNDNSAIKHFGSMKRGPISPDICGFIIYSDGAANISGIGSNTPANRIVRAIYNGTYEEEEEKVFTNSRQLSSDDISILTIAAVIPEPPNTKATATEKARQKELSHSDHIIEAKTICYTEKVPTDRNCIEKDVFDEYLNVDFNETREFMPPKLDKSDKKAEISCETEVSSFRDENNLMKFLKNYRSVNDIIESGLVNQNEVIETLKVLFRHGIISCAGDKFKIR